MFFQKKDVETIEFLGPANVSNLYIPKDVLIVEYWTGIHKSDPVPSTFVLIIW